RRARAGLYRGHARLETRRRTAPGRPHRAHRPRCAQGRQMEHALLWCRGSGRLVPRLSLLYKYVKVTFFRGTSLRPLPPGESKSQDTRYLDIREDDQLDEAQLTAWVKQAANCPANECKRSDNSHEEGDNRHEEERHK